jgi:hypothetical protein
MSIVSKLCPKLNMLFNIHLSDSVLCSGPFGSMEQNAAYSQVAVICFGIKSRKAVQRGNVRGAKL